MAVETPTMTLVSERLQRSKVRKDLETYLREARTQIERDPQAGAEGAQRLTWDDVAFEIRKHTDVRVVRESVRSWALRYGIKDETPEGGSTTDESAA